MAPGRRFLRSQTGSNNATYLMCPEPLTHPQPSTQARPSVQSQPPTQRTTCPQQLMMLLPLTQSQPSTHVHSSPPSEDSFHPITPNTESSSITKKCGRGPNKGISLQKRTHNGEKVSINISDGYLRPVRDNAKEFIREVGILSRTCILASIPTWFDVLDLEKEHVYQCLMDKFLIDMSHPRNIDAVNDIMQHALTDYHNTLSNYFKLKIDEVKDPLLHPPSRVSADEWPILCERFSSDKFKERSKQNSKNKECLQVLHVGGSTFFLQHRHNMKNHETQEECGEINHYKDVHYRASKGEWVHPLAETRWEEMQRRRDMSTIDASMQSELQIMTDVLGKKLGYVRGLGHGTKRKARSTSNSIRTALEEHTRQRTEGAERENE